MARASEPAPATPGPARPRPRAWRVLVPVICLIAGIGFATSARDSHGTELRAPGIGSLADTVGAAERTVRGLDGQVASLQAQVQAAATSAGMRDGKVSAAQRAVSPLAAAAGLTAVHGAGLQVVLDDADPSSANASVDPNQLVVHQSDLQSVVNALWAGGAEAMSIAGQRVIPTSAVRCVGNTLLLNGDVYSPPFRVAAVGPSATMQEQLTASPGVTLFRQAAGYFGLGYTVESEDRVDVPAYTGPLTLIYARPGS
ncbi:DUF881 domain-containing protein [uncultured Jatrophihabitans sp.]|uniref:DUF881 domain-containing protein n=1 Tax=uncultured Jatrophihabitans sp. TaxID=1610747 RepID=UPI0035C9E9C3